MDYVQTKSVKKQDLQKMELMSGQYIRHKTNVKMGFKGMFYRISLVEWQFEL